jgi:hypothetical protein
VESVQFVFPNGFDFWGCEMIPLRHEPYPSGPMVEIRTFNRLTWSFCTTSSKPITSALDTGVQFPNAFSDPRVCEWIALSHTLLPPSPFF